MSVSFPAITFPGMGELLVLLVIVVLLFGPGKLKGLGPALGRSIRGFKDEMNKPAEELEGAVDAATKEIDVTSEASTQRVTEAEEA